MKTLQFTEPIAAFNIEERREDAAGFLTGIVVLISLMGLFFYYLIPYVAEAMTQGR